MNNNEINTLRSDRHLFLFAKGWYKYNGNPLPALKIILSDYCGIDIKHLSDDDVYHWILMRVDEISQLDPNFKISNFISEMAPKPLRSVFLRKNWNFYTAMLEQSLSLLRFAKFNEVHLGEISKDIKKRLDFLSNIS